jgi:hypothetical protein
MYLRDDAGNEVFFNDDWDGFGNVFYSKIEKVVPAGTYYIDVRGFQRARGAYRLEIECRSGFAGVTFNQGGCLGTNGIPLLYERFSAYGGEFFEAPALGSTFSVDLAGMPANGAGVMVVGLSDALYLGVPLPIDLGIVGAPGCLAEVSIDAQLPLSGDAQGDAVFAIEIPYIGALNGAAFYCQAAVLDLGANALNITTSNSAACVIGTEVHFVQSSFL